MADSETLHLLIAELRDFYDVERQLTRALTRLPQGSSWAALRDAFETHLTETQGEVSRSERLIEDLWEKVRNHRDEVPPSVPNTAVRIAVRTGASTTPTEVPQSREDDDEGDVDTLGGMGAARSATTNAVTTERTTGSRRSQMRRDASRPQTTKGTDRAS